jgi:MoaA/NifB/PqqE/SkfB family radical SAM enzyme
MTETLLHVTTRMRGAARLDACERDAPDPTLDALTSRAASLGPVVLSGGEPTLRADLPALLGAFPTATLRTDALPLVSATTLRDLRAAGLAKLRVVLHSARPEAHDWLVGQPGAARRAMRALLAAAELGIPTEIEATLTRPTAPHVTELVALAEGVHARAVHLVRLAHRGVAAREAVMLAARFALIEDALMEAGAAAHRGRLALFVHDFPRCVAPRLGSAIMPAARVHAFVDDAAWAPVREAYASPVVSRCAVCPGAESCVGVAAEYVARFGDGEIASEIARAPRPHAELPPTSAPTSVPGRAGRPPTTRLRDVRAVVRRGEVEGDPLIDVAMAPAHVLALSFAPIDVSTRVLRARLIRAAQEGAAILRITAGFDHPQAPTLLREAARLPGPEVELVGDLSALYGWSDAQLFELAGLARVRARVVNIADLGAATTFLERLTRIAKIDASIADRDEPA